MKTNRAIRNTVTTHEGAPAKRITIHQELRRSVLSCLLWEKEFYEDGQTIGDRIFSLASQCSTEFVADLAIEARSKFNLRHVPLLLLIVLIRRGGMAVGDAIYKTIQRADELSELVSLYWQFNPNKPITRQMKRGLAKAFNKFSEYQLAKYDRADVQVKLRDVLFLCHAKPQVPNGVEANERLTSFNSKKRKGVTRNVYRHAGNTLEKLKDGALPTPNTWESRMAAGEDKKVVFTDLLQTGELGYMALLRNLRGMNEAGVDSSLIKNALLTGNKERVLPFRFIAAARHAPMFERQLDQAMQAACDEMPKLMGRTIVLVDVSASMNANLSIKSDLTRMDAAFGLAILASAICDDVRVFAFSNLCKEVPARKGMALADAILRAVPSSGTYLGSAVLQMNNLAYDRLIVVTDEQSSDPVPNPIPSGIGYMLNVASNKNGVGYGPWVHIDGFSEACITFIREYEAENNQ